MRVFKIYHPLQINREIHVTKYVRTAAGLNIKIEHNVPSAGVDLQWIQTVTSNHGNSVICNLATRVDPFGAGGGSVNSVSLPNMPGLCKADDLLPFYWTGADLAGGAGPGLSDAPQVPAPATGRTWVQFVTGLTQVIGTSITHLVLIAWGYDRMADGSVRAAAVRRASDADVRSHLKALRLMYPSYTYS
ncbi:hypothetical protein TA3x_003201 [Tundrisphaera sp. TA3]|uniref:hypothetical protein n=1 Tax=Tundrisphaera sp. TA3 TaxID=3435775 RepID=UPI003EBB3762